MHAVVNRLPVKSDANRSVMAAKSQAFAARHVSLTVTVAGFLR